MGSSSCCWGGAFRKSMKKFLAVILSFSLAFCGVSLTPATASADEYSDLIASSQANTSNSDADNKVSLADDDSGDDSEETDPVTEVTLGTVKATMSVISKEWIESEWVEDGGYWETKYRLTFQPVSGDNGEITSIDNLKSLTGWGSEISEIASTGTINVKCNMDEMFDSLSIKNVDALSNWDVSSVESMAHLFDNCNSLSDIEGLRSWNVSKVQSMSYLFSQCLNLGDLSALSNWHIDSLTV